MTCKPQHPPAEQPAVQLPVMLVAEVQDSLLVGCMTWPGSTGLLAHTMDNLMQRFTKAISGLDRSGRCQSALLDEVRTCPARGRDRASIPGYAPNS